MSAFFMNQVEINSVIAGLVACHTLFFLCLSDQSEENYWEQGLSATMFLHFGEH